MANTTNFAVEKPTVGGYRNTWGGTLNTGLDKLTELLALALPLGTIQMYPKTTAPTATTNGGTWLVCNGGSLARLGDYAELFALIGTTYGVGSSSNSSTFSLPDLRARVPVGYNDDGLSGRSTRAIALGSGAETHTLADAEIPKHQHPITDNGHIHPIDPSTTHYHEGDQTGGKTGSVSLTPTDPGHSHTFDIVNGWGSGAPYSVQSGPGHDQRKHGGADLSSTNITIDDHDHSLTTNAVPTGITTTTTNTARLTTTDNNSSGDGSHNIMQPYLVVNYIILAKHPTF